MAAARGGIELGDDGIKSRLQLVGLEERDVRRIQESRDDALRRVDDHVAAFFDAIAQTPEGRRAFSNAALLEEARRLKREHLRAMFAGDYGRRYAEERIALAALYGKAGLEVRFFLAAFHHMMTSIGRAILAGAGAGELGFERFLAVKKLAFFDLGVIVDVIVSERERTISRQQEAIKELSTPVLQLRDQLLMLPVVGMIDTYRARLLTENLLRAIRSSRARAVVIDITGVPAVDSRVANHLVQTVAAARLMGARAIVTGLSADVAQTLATLGLDLKDLDTVGDLQGGLEEAERILGSRARPESEAETVLPQDMA